MQISWNKGLVIDERLFFDHTVKRDQCWVSHAHSDHVAPHRIINATPLICDILQTQRYIGSGSVCDPVPYNTIVKRDGYSIRLKPSGHNLGSALTIVEDDKHKLIYTGDFKLAAGLTTPSADLEPCDFLVMETTFGLPNLRFPPPEQIHLQIIDWVKYTLQQREVPVLVGYTVGKTQEVVKLLCNAEIPVAVHPNIWEICKLYTRCGVDFPTAQMWNNTDVEVPKNCALVIPESTLGSASMRHIGRYRTAQVSGWCVLSRRRLRTGIDAGFPLSDHCDFDALVQAVRICQPKIVYTMHGFASEFAECLQALGFNAISLIDDKTTEEDD